MIILYGHLDIMMIKILNENMSMTFTVNLSQLIINIAIIGAMVYYLYRIFIYLKSLIHTRLTNKSYYYKLAEVIFKYQVLPLIRKSAKEGYYYLQIFPFVDWLNWRSSNERVKIFSALLIKCQQKGFKANFELDANANFTSLVIDWTDSSHKMINGLILKIGSPTPINIPDLKHD